jgi:hypothetical protein
VYLAEIARKEKRGSLIIIQQLAIEVGILVVYFIGMFHAHTCLAHGRAANFIRLRLHFHRQSSFLPYCLEHTTCTLSLPYDWSTFPARVTEMACKGRPV